MLSKIGIGTANFTQNYGILAGGDTINVNPILKIAFDNKIDTFDTAFAYGDFLGLVSKHLFKLKIITKFSVLDNYDDIFQKMKKAKEQYNFDGYYGLLIHDPQNLGKADKSKLLDLFDKLQNGGLVKKIGISVYDLNGFENYRNIREPDLIQIPLNPLNQKFVNDKFIDYVEKHEIEVHARSLFLQGILLSDKLPQSLKDLKPLWTLYMEAMKPFKSRLDALLSWAFAHKWISKWVLGVSSEVDLIEIIESKECTVLPVFLALKNMTHIMADPRNWKIA